MRILVVYCHPSPASFVASILAELRPRLEAQGHEVQVLDLYAEGFDPVLGPEAWRAHRANEAHGTPDLADHITALRDADGLIFVFPTWWFGLPAPLKGWIDRVWRPKVAFDIAHGAFQLHYLPRLKRFAAITTYGSPRLVIEWIVGDPVRRQLMRGLVLQFARGCRRAWAPIYNVDTRTREDLARARGRAVVRVARLFARR
jgi:putative NADPH-quinone reductase